MKTMVLITLFTVFMLSSYTFIEGVSLRNFGWTFLKLTNERALNSMSIAATQLCGNFSSATAAFVKEKTPPKEKLYKVLFAATFKDSVVRECYADVHWNFTVIPTSITVLKAGCSPALSAKVCL